MYYTNTVTATVMGIYIKKKKKAQSDKSSNFCLFMFSSSPSSICVHIVGRVYFAFSFDSVFVCYQDS